MLSLSELVRIYCCTQPTDMRKSSGFSVEATAAAGRRPSTSASWLPASATGMTRLSISAMCSRVCPPYYLRPGETIFSPCCRISGSPLDTSLARRPSRHSHVFRRTLTFLAKRDPDKAIADCTEAIRRSPKGAEMYFSFVRVPFLREASLTMPSLTVQRLSDLIRE
jgi:hypothetical protein